MTQDERDVEALTKDAAAGDRDALEQRLTRMLPDLRAFVRLRAGRLVQRHDEHSDIVQSVCREILAGAERFDHPGEAAFRRWLFTTTLRKLSDRRDHHTAARRDAVQAALGASDQERLLEAYGRVATPSNHAAVREELERVERAMHHARILLGRERARRVDDAPARATGPTAGPNCSSKTRRIASPSAPCITR